MPRDMERISAVMVIGEDLNNVAAIICLQSVSGRIICGLDT